MKFIPSVLLLSCVFVQAQAATAPAVTVKQTGASFLEAPPGREKNLVPFGTMGAQEKVEAHAVIMFSNRLIADIPAFGEEGKVNVTALLSNKSQVALGTASLASFRKVSEDGKKTLVSLSVTRLPDSNVSGVVFSGVVKLPVATAIVRTAAAFQAKVGERIDVGLGNLVIAKLEPNALTFSGDDRLTSVAAVRLIKPDGSALTGERAGYSRQGGPEGSVVSSYWRFSAPLTAGKIEIATYRDLTTFDVPINLIVTKPY